MMGSSQMILLLLLCCVSAPSASTFISDVEFGHQVVNERKLLQAEKPCRVNFENQNYTILTSQCRGPHYSPKPCCDALKQFACPFADSIDDLTTNCARVMFSYINKIGHYPNGLFSSFCREGKEGLACPDATTPPPLPPLPRRNGGACVRILKLQLLLLLLFSLHFIMRSD